MFKRPKSPRILQLFLIFDILWLVSFVWYYNPINLYQCGLVGRVEIVQELGPYWTNGRFVFMRGDNKIILGNNRSEAKPIAGPEWIKNGQQYRKILAYGIPSSSKTLYFKALDWEGATRTFALDPYVGPEKYQYEMVAVDNPPKGHVQRWVKVDPKSCRVAYGLFPILASFLILLISIVIRGGHAFDLPIRFLRLVVLHKSSD